MSLLFLLLKRDTELGFRKVLPWLRWQNRSEFCHRLRHRPVFSDILEGALQELRKLSWERRSVNSIIHMKVVHLMDYGETALVGKFNFLRV